MFLSKLSEEEQKGFLDLVDILNDENINAEEEKLVAEYKEELGLNYNPTKKNFDEVILSYKNSSKENKIIVYFELMGLALCDGNYEADEEVFMNNVKAAFEISDEIETRVFNWFAAVKKLYDETEIDWVSAVGRLEREAEDIISK
ncbi:hypothetical protein KQI30_02140 [Clostridium bornimense]|uniref:hypothetical protein n=1 Tax=Clostridium bornimense TaxID=1216932 RepID=UPI001C10CD49|nr:hypothetical protein [Clostridium bornimense]MBU5315075.1 hypothetical protein [Clostridium bornimense]